MYSPNMTAFPKHDSQRQGVKAFIEKPAHPVCITVTPHFQVPSPVLESRVRGIFLGSRYKPKWCLRTCPVDRAGQGNLLVPAPVEETKFSKATEDAGLLFSPVPRGLRGFNPMVCVHALNSQEGPASRSASRVGALCPACDSHSRTAC